MTDDETVRVPAADIWALAERTKHKTTDHLGNVTGYLIAADDLRALVDAADTPCENEKPPRMPPGDDPRAGHPIPSLLGPTAPAAPVGEPLCRCGHNEHWHPKGYCRRGNGDKACDCEAFTPAPLSSPRRTRDEGITLTNEERADLTAELADYTMDVRVDPNTVARIALGPVIAANIVEAVLRFRAARLAGEDA